SSGANLRGVDLRGVDLADANLRGAYHIFPIAGDIYIWHVVRWDDGIRIQAGCHWFTVQEAQAHWIGKGEHGAICRASINAAVAMAKVRGWKI
ncbi:hypothetical protein LCGC14_2789670, partial [marine sediment metagenome]